MDINEALKKRTVPKKRRKKDTPTKEFKTIAKKSGKKLSDLERYWNRAQKSVDRAARKGKPIKNKYAYKMATTLRQAQRTGPRPHKKLGKPRIKKTRKEGFEMRIDQILESVQW